MKSFFSVTSRTVFWQKIAVNASKTQLFNNISQLFYRTLSQENDRGKKKDGEGNVARQVTVNGRSYILETDKKYFMVESDRLLQLFRRLAYHLQWNQSDKILLDKPREHMLCLLLRYIRHILI